MFSILNFYSLKKRVQLIEFLLSISVVYIKEEIDCDKLSVKIEPNVNNLGFCEDTLNVKRKIEINEEENGEEEVVIKEEPRENDLVSGSKVTLLKWLLTYFFHLSVFY